MFIPWRHRRGDIASLIWGPSGCRKSTGWFHPPTGNRADRCRASRAWQQHSGRLMRRSSLGMADGPPGFSKSQRGLLRWSFRMMTPGPDEASLNGPSRPGDEYANQSVENIEAETWRFPQYWEHDTCLDYRNRNLSTQSGLPNADQTASVSANFLAEVLLLVTFLSQGVRSSPPHFQDSRREMGGGG